MQPYIRVPITLLVLKDLRGPVFGVGSSLGAVDRTAMPEATIDKYREMHTHKDNVCSSAQAG